MTSMRRVLRNMFRRAATVWAQLGFLIIFLLLLDLVCWIFSPLTYLKSHDDPAVREYPNDPGVREFAAVADKVRVKWHPYNYFLTTPLKARDVNINQDGIRTTWREPGNAGRPRPIRIFVFGGSAIFGEYARDDYTIPSLLAKGLADRGLPVEVTNLGQEGFCSAQEVILLREQMLKGNIPDLVIFYDGVNDTATAFENRSPGLTYDELIRSREFDLLNPIYRPRLLGLAFYNAARFSAAGLTAQWLAEHVLPRASYDVRLRVADVRFNAAGLRAVAAAPNSALADAVVKTYVFNKEVVEALGARFGFRSLFFWQPAVFEKDRPAPFEKSMAAKWEKDFPGFESFFRLTYAALREVSAKEHIVDLSRVFDGDARSYYTDDAHLTEAGNAVVVKAMLPRVRPVVEELVDARKITGR